MLILLGVMVAGGGGSSDVEVVADTAVDNTTSTSTTTSLAPTTTTQVEVASTTTQPVTRTTVVPETTTTEVPHSLKVGNPTFSNSSIVELGTGGPCSYPSMPATTLASVSIDSSHGVSTTTFHWSFPGNSGTQGGVGNGAVWSTTIGNFSFFSISVPSVSVSVFAVVTDQTGAQATSGTSTFTLYDCSY